MGDDSQNITPEENWLVALKQQVSNFASDAVEKIDTSMAELGGKILPQLDRAKREYERVSSENGISGESEIERRNKAAATEAAIANVQMTESIMNMDFSDPQSIDNLESKLANDEYWQYLQDNPKEREKLAQHVTGGLLDGIDKGTISHEDIDKVQGRSKHLLGGQASIDALHAYKDGKITREQAEAIGQSSRKQMEATPQQVTDVEVEKHSDIGLVGNVDNVLDKSNDASRSVRQDLTKNEELAKVTSEKVELENNSDLNDEALLAQAFASANGKETAKAMNEAGIQDKGEQTEIATNTAPKSDELSQDSSRGSPA